MTDDVRDTQPLTAPGDIDDLVLRLATTLAPMLLTLAVFMLTTAGLLSERQSGGFVAELLFVAAFGSVLTAAFLIDHLLDLKRMTIGARLKYLGFGYPFFCAVVALVAATIPLLYDARRTPEVPLGWSWFHLAFIGLGVAVWSKLMTQDDKGLSGIFMGAAVSAGSIYFLVT
jgi:hypothetical protein